MKQIRHRRRAQTILSLKALPQLPTTRLGIKIGYSEKGSRKAASSMPNKHNALRRHHIPKMKFRVKNWAEYDAGSSASRQSDFMGHRRSTGRLECGTSDDPWRAIGLFRARNRDGHDAAPGFSSGVASNRGTDGFYFRPAGCATEHA